MISKPRIFLADDNQTSFDFFKGIAELEGWIVAGYASDFDSFMNRAPQSDADVMLVSAGFLGVMSIRDRRALKAEMPERIVLAITDSDDYVELKASVRAGARDCVNASESIDLIACTIYEYFAEAASARDLIANKSAFTEETAKPRAVSGKVVAFCGADGGTGKSFLALQAAGMASLHAGAKTCLVDFDLRCGALSAVIGEGAQGARSLGDLAEVIDEIKPFHIENLLREHTGGFSVISGPAQAIAEVDNLFERVISPLKEMFDAIIVDFPPNPGFAFPSSSIDAYYIAISPDTVSAFCARQMASIITAKYEHVEVAGIINRCDRPGALKSAEISRLSGLEIAAEVPEDEGAGRLFDRKGKVLAASPDLALIKGLIPAVQRIKDFDELVKPSRLPVFGEWRLPWAAKTDA